MIVINYIKFGIYEQDNSKLNGKEVIEWLVLDIKDGKALVISKYELDCKQYNTSYTSVTWETCSLRKWLNNNFTNTAFSVYEKEIIPTVTVSADKNPDWSTNPGNATADQIFLLSIDEASKYFTSAKARRCKPTLYAIENGAYVDKKYDNCCNWWLRSPSKFQDRAALVVADGDFLKGGWRVDADLAGIRPAMWIQLP